MIILFKIATGLIITGGLGYVVRRVLSSKTPAPHIPDNKIPDDVWKQLTQRGDGGKWIGILERYFCLAVFWTGNGTLVAAWLAFKVASKWEVWKNINQVPSKLDGVADADWFGLRAVYGSWILTRFWIGTLGNILAGLIGAYFASHSDALWVSLRGVISRVVS
jgi:hypothetical protein